MRYWSKKTDFLAIRAPLFLFILYLCLTVINGKAFVTSNGWTDNGLPITNNSVYLWLQFTVFIFISTITSFYFEETFRKSSASYLSVFKLGVWKTVFVRYLRLLILLECIYLPFVIISFIRVNNRIELNSIYFGEYYKSVNTAIPLVQCSVAMLFYVTVTMFLMMIFKSRIYTMILCMAYCAVEATIGTVVFGNYAVFRGAFNNPDYHTFLPPNVIIMLVLSLVILIFTVIKCIIANK